MKCDMINNQSIANLVVDMAWMSGVATTTKKIQAALGLKADGIIGPKTLGKLNDKNSRMIFDTL